MESILFKEYCDRVNILLITPHGRAGSLFFQGLFDQHPNVIVLPYFFNTYQHWDERLSLDENLQLFYSQNKNLFFAFSSFLKSGFSKSENLEKYNMDFSFFINKMKLVLINNEVIDNKIFVLAVYFVFGMFYGIELRNVRYCLYHVHFYNFESRFNYPFGVNTAIHNAILKDFPNCFYVPLIKNPFLSLKSYFIESENVLEVLLIFLDLKNAFSCLKIFEETYHNFLPISLEELHKNPLFILQHLLSRMGIPYVHTLATCTYRGIEWNGFSKIYSKKSTFCLARSKEYKGEKLFWMKNDLTDFSWYALARYVNEKYSFSYKRLLKQLCRLWVILWNQRMEAFSQEYTYGKGIVFSYCSKLYLQSFAQEVSFCWYIIKTIFFMINIFIRVLIL